MWFRGHLISELIRRTDLHDCDWPEYDSLVEEKKIMKNSEKIPETKSFTEKLEETKKNKEKNCPRLPRLSPTSTSVRSPDGPFTCVKRKIMKNWKKIKFFQRKKRELI